MNGNREQYIIELIDKGVSKGLRGIQDDVTRLRGSMAGATQSVGKSGGGGLMGALGGLKTLGVAVGVGLLAKKVLTLGADMETTRVSFSTFLGDTEKANKLLTELNTFANITPFDNAEVMKSGQMLLSAGMSADAVGSSLSMIGDIASGVAMPLEDLSQIYMKAMNKGKLQAEELNQMSERGIPIMSELARMTGKSKGELYKLAESGAITSDVVTQAFTNMTSQGGNYFNMMEKKSETGFGKWSTLVGNLQTIGMSIGENIMPVLIKGMNGVIWFMDLITKNASALGNVFHPVIDALDPLWASFKKVGQILGFVDEKGKSTGNGMSFLSGIFTLIGWTIENVVAPPLNMIATVIGKVIEVVASVSRAFYDWFQKTKWVKDAIAGLVGLFTGAFTRIKNVAVNILGGIGDLLIGIFTLDKNKIGAGMKQLGKAFLEGNPISAGMGMAKDFSKGYSKGLDIKPVKLVDPSASKTETSKKNSVTARSLSGATKLLPKGKDGKTNISAGLSEVRASAPKTFNINIGSLIKEQTFETVKDVTEIKNIIRTEVSRLLLGVVNDVQTS